MAAKASSGKTESGRGHLQRENIVQTALALMNDIGLDALSLRRLADELHVQAPALYWHFKNKQELLDEMAEVMIMGAYESPAGRNPPEEWSEWLLAMGHSLRGALLKYRDGARLLASADVSKGSILSLDLSLGVLIEAGFDYQPALVGILTIVNYTLGFTFEEQATTQQPGDIEHLRELITSNNLRYLAAAFEQINVPMDSDSEFEAGLKLMIAGLKVQHT